MNGRATTHPKKRFLSWLIVACLVLAAALYFLTPSGKPDAAATSEEEPSEELVARDALADVEAPADREVTSSGHDHAGPGDGGHLPGGKADDTPAAERTVAGSRNPEEVEGRQGGRDKKKGSGPADPLGTDAGADELSQTDRDRAWAVAEQYVRAVYGYSGSDVRGYQDIVTRTVLAPEFFQSPGGKAVEAFSAKASTGGGVEAAAALEDFTVEESDGEYVTGTARFTLVEDGEDPVMGSATYEERLRLVRWDPVFKVLAADGPEKAERGKS